jgi:acetyltransferase-like isoleucine patch superfamily enzyme
MTANRLCQLGPDAQIDPDVILGYQYRGNTQPLVIGAHAIIRAGSILYANTRIGKRFSCGHHVLIRAQCDIADRVVINHKCTLEGMVSIGHGVKIMAHVYIPSRTRIGNLAFIGPNCTFLNDKYPMRNPQTPKGATLGDGVCVGGGVTICPGITIGDRSFIGAGAVVNKDVPPDTLAVGVPARFQPLPDALRGGNWPELAMTGTDLWEGQLGDDWRADFPDLPPRPHNP